MGLDVGVVGVGVVGVGVVGVVGVVDAGHSLASASLTLPAVSVSNLTTRVALSSAASSSLVREVTSCSEHPRSVAVVLVIALVNSRALEVS